MLSAAVKRDGKFQNPVSTQVGGLSMIFKILPLLLANREERTPRNPLGPFRTDARIFATPPESGLRVTWFGHSSMLLEIDGATVLIDPVWDERAAPTRWAGPKRFFPPTMPLEEMPAIDAVLVSHDHYDHLGKATVQKLSKLEPFARAQWITSLGVGRLLQRFGVAAEGVVELVWGENLVFARGASPTASLPARLFPGRSLSNRFETLWASFVIRGKDHTI